MDYLFGTPYRIEQGREMYHFNSDSELLGRFLRLKENDRVLDVGTNNGVLLCYAALQKPERLTGIDLFPEVLDLCARNLAYNGIAAELYATPLQQFEHAPFTALICNPPFFTTANASLKSQNRYLRAARHTDFLALSDLFFHGSRLLEPGGTLTLIIPHAVTDEAFAAAAEQDFHLRRIAAVYDHPSSRSKPAGIKRCLLEFVLYSKTTIEVEPMRYLDRLHAKEEHSEKALKSVSF